MKKFAYIAPVLAFIPSIAFAQVAGNNLQSLIRFAGDILNMLIPILIVMTLLAFFYGLFLYVWNNDSKKGRSVMLAGITALFIMVSVWGIIRLVQNTLGVSSGGALPAPVVPQR